MYNKKIDLFLEEHNMNYLYLILTNLEIKRLNNLPPEVKQKFTKKIPEMALEHIADNFIPDYTTEEENIFED